MTLHDAILFDLELLPMSTWRGLRFEGIPSVGLYHAGGQSYLCHGRTV
jgi:hypothetical protein